MHLFTHINPSTKLIYKAIFYISVSRSIETQRSLGIRACERELPLNFTHIPRAKPGNQFFRGARFCARIGSSQVYNSSPLVLPK